MTSPSSPFFLGADLSSLLQVLDAGTSFSRQNVSDSLFTILSDVGFNYGRLRLWDTPSNVEGAVDNYCDLNHTIAVAQQMVGAGWGYLLDIHYSDWWADPANQHPPLGWQNLSFQDLASVVFNYTREVLDGLVLAGAPPSMIQVGNEINHGFLWPEGHISNLTKFTTLLDSAIRAIKTHPTLGNTPVMIHFAPGTNMSGYQWFFDSLLEFNISFDTIGVSFYPKWHGTLAQLSFALLDMTERYQKEVIVVETAYPWTIGWNDDHSNVFWKDSLHEGYPASPEGQRLFLTDLVDVVKSLPNSLGRGVFLWEPAWITPSVGGSPMENAGLFDFTNNLLDVYTTPLVKLPVSTTSPASTITNTTTTAPPSTSETITTNETSNPSVSSEKEKSEHVGNVQEAMIVLMAMLTSKALVVRRRRRR